jgi:hypothetical protein
VDYCKLPVTTSLDVSSRRSFWTIPNRDPLQHIYGRTDGGMFDRLDAPCHTLRMVSYAIVPRGRAYWITATDETGSRRTIERFDTEDMAVQRLRVLQADATTVEWQKYILRPETRR